MLMCKQNQILQIFNFKRLFLTMFHSPISESVFISGPEIFFQNIPDIMLFGQYYHKITENQNINIIKFFMKTIFFNFSFLVSRDEVRARH